MRSLRWPQVVASVSNDKQSCAPEQSWKYTEKWSNSARCKRVVLWASWVRILLLSPNQRPARSGDRWSFIRSPAVFESQAWHQIRGIKTPPTVPDTFCFETKASVARMSGSLAQALSLVSNHVGGPRLGRWASYALPTEFDSLTRIQTHCG